jgi:putative membrane protein
MTKLSRNDHDQLHRAIADAELHSGTHVALVVVPASDRYVMYPLAYGALFALAIGGAFSLFGPHVSLREAFAAEALGFAAFSLLFDWLPLGLRLVPRTIRNARSRNLAHREFAARILTTHRGGLLLFVSLSERYVELLADRALHARVGQPTWDRIVSELTASARTQPLTEALLAAIASCSAALPATKSG